MPIVKNVIINSSSQGNMQSGEDPPYTEDHQPVQTLFVYNVPQELSYSALREHFFNVGFVQSLQISWLDGRLGTGFVTFAKKKDAARALLSHVRYLNGCNFNVKASNCCEVTDQLALSLPNWPPSIMTLNDDCLEHIMKNLTLPDQVHFARTCLRFRGVYQAATARLHKSVELSQFEAMTDWEVRDFSQMSGAQVQEVSGFLRRYFVGRLCDFLTSCTNLKKLYIDCSDLLYVGFSGLFNKLESGLKLESLELKMPLTDKQVWVLRNLRSLKSLDLSGSPLEGSDLNKLPANIEILTLSYCRSFNALNLKKVFMKLHQLKELNIQNIKFPYFCEDIFKDHCMSLETLRLSAHTYIAYEFVAQLPSLKRLALFVTGYLRKELFEQLVEHKATQLENLEIDGWFDVTEESLLNIGKLSELRGLILTKIESEAALGDAFTNLQKLEQFTLRYADNVSDNTILKLFGNCRKLSYIVLPRRELSEKLVQGIVSRVQQETKKEMQRMLPIELRSTEPFKHSDKFPRDIIHIKYGW